MATDVQIASLALTRVGHSNIASFSSSGDKAQRWFDANYETIKKALLAEHTWNFAVKRASLSSTTAPTNEYTYAYTLPSDFIRLVRLNGDSKSGYRIERGTLATYESSAVIEYIYDVTDEATFTASFTDLLAQRLAAEICFFLTDNSGLTEQCWKVFQDKFAKAKSIDSREAAPRYRSANMALARLGETTRQGEDGSYTLENAARLIEANYATCRKALLREHPWGFAIKRASLSGTTTPTNDFAYAYTLPSDFIRMVRLNASNEVTYRIETGGTLVTDSATAVIEYVADITDEDAYSPDFLDILAQRLAAEASAAINPQSAQGFWSIYQSKLAQAKATDSREAAPRKKAANLALIKLGEVAGRAGEDASVSRENAARTVEGLWDSCRLALLREHPWNFAIKRATLTAGTSSSGEYAYSNNLPSDFVRAVRVNSSIDGFRIEGSTIKTNIDGYVLEYVYDLTTEASFSGEFAELLAQRIAAEAAVSINPTAAQMLWTVYQNKLVQAKATDGREGAPTKKAAALALFKLGDVGGRGGDDVAQARETAARVVDGLWDSCRKDLLRAHTWNFASKSAVLVSAGGSAWTLPSDFIRAIRINSTEIDGFRILNGQLLSAEADVTLEYVYDVTTEASFDATFAELLAQRIAAEAASAVNPGAANALWSVYQQKLAIAIDADTREQAAYNIVTALAFARLGDVSGKVPMDQMNAKKGAIYRTLNVMYAYTRKALLREHNWNFAIKRAILTKSTIRTITGATAANPVVITSAAHGFANGDTVYIDSIVGMTELNGRTFTVANQATNTFQLSGENGSAYTAYSSGGSAYPYIAKEYRYRFQLPVDCLRLIRINRTEADEYRVEGGYIYTDESDVDLEYVYDASDEDEFDPQFVDVFAQRLAAEAAANLNPGASGAMWNIYENKLRMARTMNSREGTPRGMDADIWMDSRA